MTCVFGKTQPKYSRVMSLFSKFRFIHISLFPVKKEMIKDILIIISDSSSYYVFTPNTSWSSHYTSTIEHVVFPDGNVVC